MKIVILMKKTIYNLLLLFCGLLVFPQISRAFPDDPVCVYLKSGRVEAFPKAIVKEQLRTETQLTIVLDNDKRYQYPLSDVDSLGTVPTNLATFTSFKFNNKFNEGLYDDAYGTIQGNQIAVDVAAIGKRLTPSFKLSNDSALVFVDGQRQESKVSRLRFDEPKQYTVAMPNHFELDRVKVSDEIWSEGHPGTYESVPVELNANMLSTNAPSNYGEDLYRLVDGDPYTFFHSTWGSGAHQKLPLDQHPYIQVDLVEPLENLVFEYTTSNSHTNRFPLAILVQASDDGDVWQDVEEVKEGMPSTGVGVSFTSPVIHLGAAYRYLRFVLTKASYKNYFVLSYFGIKKVTRENPPTPPHLISPAQYDYRWMPMGNIYDVQVNWLTDGANRVPRVEINIDGGEVVQDKINYLGADIQFNGNGVFPDTLCRVQIKGRGNISWKGPNGKSPFRLKFAASVKPFGMKKGKNWVLLANNQTGSMMTNAVAMKLARMVGTAGANDIVPVELYINGEYRGSYNLTQHVGLHNNSVDIDETRAVLLELDSYYDETYKFLDNAFGVCTNVKDPDLEDLPVDEADSYFQRIQEEYNHFTEVLYNGSGDYARYVDVPMLARYLLVNELVANLELKHPKSCFLYREDIWALHSPYVYGPVWDFDWAFGYEKTYSYCQANPLLDFYDNLHGAGAPYFRALRFNSDEVKRECYREWKNFMDHHLEELKEFVADYCDFALPSFNHNLQRWSDYTDYEDQVLQMQQWIDSRAKYIYKEMEVYDLATPLPITLGDVNGDKALTAADVVVMQQYLLGNALDVFDRNQADVNEDGQISIADLIGVVALVMRQEVDASRHLRLARAEARMQSDRFAVQLNETATVPVRLEVSGKGYGAVQFDVDLPEGMTLEGVDLADGWNGCEVDFTRLEGQRYRVLAYAAHNESLRQGTTTFDLQLRPEKTIAEDQRVVSFRAAMLVNAEGEDERLAPSSARFDMSPTGISNVLADAVVRGGDVLTVETLSAGDLQVYTLEGRLFRSCPVVAGKNRIVLPAGIYVVNHQKVMIR